MISESLVEEVLRPPNDRRHEQHHPSPLATWWVQATVGVNYYRAYLPARHLPGQCLSVQPEDITWHPTIPGSHVFPRQVGPAIWLFAGVTARALMMAEMHLQGYRVLMEVDDNYATSHPPLQQISTWGTTMKRRGPTGYSYEEHRKIVSSDFCHGVIVSTPALEDVYGRFNENVYVCPNSVDPDDWDPNPPHQEDGILRIGWAGSPGHMYDLNDIQRALDWAYRQPDVEIVVAGGIHPGVPHYQIPWTDSLAEYRRNVTAIDVMLCPIRSNSWSDCKSDVKAMEAALAGACSVMSDVPPYSPWKGKPGYFAQTPKDFLRVVKHLVANREEVRETARLAREYVLAERDIRDSVHLWREALES